MTDGIAVAVADAHGIDPVGQSREWVGECLPGECHSRHLRARHVIDADAIVPIGGHLDVQHAIGGINVCTVLRGGSCDAVAIDGIFIHHHVTRAAREQHFLIFVRRLGDRGKQAARGQSTVHRCPW